MFTLMPRTPRLPGPPDTSYLSYVVLGRVCAERFPDEEFRRYEHSQNSSRECSRPCACGAPSSNDNWSGTSAARTPRRRDRGSRPHTKRRASEPVCPNSVPTIVSQRVPLHPSKSPRRGRLSI